MQNSGLNGKNKGNNNDFGKLLSEFDNELYEDYYPYVKTKKLVEAYNIANGKSDEEKSQQILWEMSLLNMTVSFHPDTDIPDRWKWYEEHIFTPLPFWEREAVPYFRKRAATCRNNLHRARYLYFLWTVEKKFEDIKTSAKLFLETAIEYVENRWYFKSFQLTPFLFRFSVKIWKSLNAEEEFKSGLQATLKAIEKEYSEGDRRWLLELCEIPVKYAVFLKEEQNARLIEIANECTSYHENLGNYHLARSYLYLLRDLYINLRKEDDRKEIMRKIATLFEREAKRRSDSNIVKAMFLEDAMNVYAEIGDTKKKDELKNAISKIDKTKELKRIGTEIKIDHKKFDMYIDKLTGQYDGALILYFSGKDPFYVPPLKEAKKMVKELKKDFSLQFLFPYIIEDEYGNKVEISGDENIEEFKLKEQMVFRGQINQIFISRLIDKLIISSKLNTDVFERFMVICQFPDDSVKILKEAYMNYSEMRYASAITLMIPQIEVLIRVIYQQYKVPIISIRSSGPSRLQATILSGLLTHPKANDILGEDFTFYMKCFLVDPTSVNYRNRICHGNLKYEGYSKALADSILYVIIRLGAILYDKIVAIQKNSDRGGGRRAS